MHSTNAISTRARFVAALAGLVVALAACGNNATVRSDGAESLPSEAEQTAAASDWLGQIASRASIRVDTSTWNPVDIAATTEGYALILSRLAGPARLERSGDSPFRPRGVRFPEKEEYTFIVLPIEPTGDGKAEELWLEMGLVPDRSSVERLVAEAPKVGTRVIASGQVLPDGEVVLITGHGLAIEQADGLAALGGVTSREPSLRFSDLLSAAERLADSSR